MYNTSMPLSLNFSIDNYSMFPQTDGELHMELHQSSLFPLLLADTTDRFKYKFYKSKYLKTLEATILVTESLIWGWAVPDLICCCNNLMWWAGVTIWSEGELYQIWDVAVTIWSGGPVYQYDLEGAVPVRGCCNTLTLVRSSETVWENQNRESQ